MIFAKPNTNYDVSNPQKPSSGFLSGLLIFIATKQVPTRNNMFTDDKRQIHYVIHLETSKKSTTILHYQSSSNH